MSKPNFSLEVKQEVLEESNWLCQHCKEERISDFHHRLPNNKYNQKKYPKFLQSKKNCAGLCRKCHLSGEVTKLLRISDEEAQKFEEELK